MGELGYFLNVGAGAGESVEHGVKVGTWLHRDDTELVLLVNPHQEGLVVVVEDTSALGPFTVKAASLQESVSLPILNINIYIFKKKERRRDCT